MSKTEPRRIRREAMSIAVEEWEDRRSEWVERLETMRNEADVQKTHIDEALDRPRNWYSNRIRGGKHSHDFSLLSYHEVRIYLEEYGEEELPLSEVETRARDARNEDVMSLERMRGLLDVDMRTIDDFVNRSRGWYEDGLVGDVSFQLHDYVRVEIFLESMVQFAYHTDLIGDEEVDGLIEDGVVSSVYLDL